MLQFGASLTDDTRSVNYDRNTFKIQATDVSKSKCWYSNNCLQFLKCAVPLDLKELGASSQPFITY